MVMRLVLFRDVFLVFSVVLGLSKVHAGAEQDSAFVKTLINNAKEVAERNFDSAHLIFEQAKSKARTIGKQVLYADVMMEEGVVFFYEGMYQQAIKLFKEAGIVYNNTKLYSREAQCYSNIGLCFQYINDYSSSLQYLFRSLGIAEKYNDIENILSSCLNLGIAYSDLRYWDNSLVYYNKAGKYAAQNKDTFILAKVNNNLAEVFYEKKEFDTAKKYFKRAIRYHKLCGNDALSASSMSNLSNVFANMGLIDSAIFYKEQALSMFEPYKSQFPSDYCFTVSTLGSYYSVARRMKDARIILSKCDECKDYLADPSFALNYYVFLFNYYKNAGDINKALESMELLNKLKDSISVQSMDIENQRMAVQYEFRKKSLEDSLNYQVLVTQKEVEAAKYKNRVYILAIVLLIFGVIVALVIWKIRRVQEEKREQVVKAMRKDIAGDLHDDVGSTLSSIQIYSKILKDHSIDNPKISEVAENIEDLTHKVSV